MEGKYSFFNVSITLGNASMLAKVFAPRFHQKRFHKSLGIGRIAIQTPPECAITPADASHLSHGVTKFLGPIRIDAIFEKNYYRSPIRFGFYNADRFPPMHPRCEAQVVSADETIAKSRGKTNQ